MCVCSFAFDSLTPWIVTYQVPLSLKFSRQEYWSGLPFLSAGDLPNPGVESWSPSLQVDSLLSHKGSPSKLMCMHSNTVWSLHVSLSDFPFQHTMVSPAAYFFYIPTILINTLQRV